MVDAADELDSSTKSFVKRAADSVGAECAITTGGKRRANGYSRAELATQWRQVFLQSAQANIEDYVDPWAREYVAPALAGDEEAAFNLAAALSNKKRGVVVVAFWRAKAPKAAFRTLLAMVWEHDHAILVAAAGTRRCLRSIFRYAQFDTGYLPPLIQVWRGGSGISVARLARGYSWTTDRDVACWFAMRHAERRGGGVVLTAQVSRETVVHFSDERSEQEVVVLESPPCEVDGHVSDWQERYIRHAKKIATRKLAFAVPSISGPEQ
jgi:hypothetical protein